MKLKKGIVSVSGNEVEQFVLENKKDVRSFIKEFPKMSVFGLRDTFDEVIDNGGTVILDTNENVLGLYSWRTTGEENWKLVRIL